jgi:hypothetical protein
MQGTIQHVEASGGDEFIPIIQYMVTALPIAWEEGTTLGQYTTCGVIGGMVFRQALLVYNNNNKLYQLLTLLRAFSSIHHC